MENTTVYVKEADEKAPVTPPRKISAGRRIGALFVGLFCFIVTNWIFKIVLSVLAALVLPLFGIHMSENPRLLLDVKAGASLLAMIPGIYAFIKGYKHIIYQQPKDILE